MKTGNKILVVAAIITAIIVFSEISFFLAKTPAFPSQLNEWGDFLAGFFSPLIFVWLIAGYIMQSAEMSNSVAEMRATTEELSRQSRSIENNEKHSRRQTRMEIKKILDQRLVMICLSFAMRLPFGRGHNAVQNYRGNTNQAGHLNSDLLFGEFSEAIIGSSERFTEALKSSNGQSAVPYIQEFIRFANLEELHFAADSDDLFVLLDQASPAKKLATILTKYINN